MCEGYGSHSVCLSVTKLAAAATYLICEPKVQCYKVPYGVPNACIVWISPKLLRLLPLFNWNRIKDHNYWIRNLGVD